MKSYSINFSEPDQHGEIHASLEMPLSIKDKQVYLQLAVNSGEPAQYLFQYHDAGTVGYASMRGQFAINGRLSNVSMDWTNPKETDYGIINAVGVIDNGVATLILWKGTKHLQVSKILINENGKTFSTSN